MAAQNNKRRLPKWQRKTIRGGCRNGSAKRQQAAAEMAAQNDNRRLPKWQR
jgi:hypothetical protein